MSSTGTIVLIAVLIVGVLVGPFLAIKAVASFRSRRKSNTTASSKGEN